MKLYSKTKEYPYMYKICISPQAFEAYHFNHPEYTLATVGKKLDEIFDKIPGSVKRHTINPYCFIYLHDGENINKEAWRDVGLSSILYANIETKENAEFRLFTAAIYETKPNEYTKEHETCEYEHVDGHRDTEEDLMNYNETFPEEERAFIEEFPLLNETEVEISLSMVSYE